MRHGERATEVIERWRDELAALGGRDPLLSFRDLKVGTLDLAAAEPEARRELLDGAPVPLSSLFPHEPLRSSALRSARAVRDKARELFEERGLVVSLLAVGITTWSNPFLAHRPTAPLLLRTASVEARDAAETDFLITVREDPMVNPVLLHALDTQIGLRFHADDLRDHAGQLKYTTAVERLREFAPAHVVDGFSIAHRAVLATFATEPLLLSRDLDNFGGELAQHDVVAALAGDEKAREAVAVPPTRATPEYVSVDTDADQLDAIAAAAGEGSFLLDAPPGTGRTQTVAGMAAELMGRGKRVLVVSSKRATAADVATRLSCAGLGDLVLDVGDTSPGEAVQRVVTTARQLQTPEPADEEQSHEDGEGDGDAAEHGRRLDAYRDAVHRTRQPWNISAYDAMVAIATAPEGARTSVRMPAEALEQMTSPSDLRARMREYAELEGLTLTKEGSPWWGADVRTPSAADSLATTVVGLRDTYVPALRDAVTRAAVEVGLSGPSTVAECEEIVELLTSVKSTVDTFGTQIWSEPLDDLVAATGSRAARAGMTSKPGLLARRRLRRRASELAGGAGRQQRESLHQQLIAARDRLEEWKQRARDGKLPRTGEYLAKAADAMTEVRRRLAVLAEANSRTRGFPELLFAELSRRLNALAMDDRHLRALPRLTTLEGELNAAGLDPLLEELRNRGVRPERAVQTLEYVQFASLLDHWRATDPALRGFDLAEHRRLAEEFRAADQARVLDGAKRVLRAHATHVREACAEFEGQAEVLVGEGARDVPRTPRRLVDLAPDIALAAIPCWVMSPLSVAGALPARRLFDVVIVDDAARMPVPEAIPALARAGRVVLVADEELAQPPFTTAVEPAPDPDEQEGPWANDPPVSVVEALRDVMPALALRTQYRARDDRLVGFAARTTYSGRMTSVPAAWGSGRVALELVDAPTGGDDPVDSSSVEVKRVIDLVVEHLRHRPYESLGVITLGPRHAERLDAALRRALVRAPDIADLLREDRNEAFFVKDVDRVAGDVRDAIILSLGYGRSVDGRILYRFGALGRPGGERRLASATTRARERFTVVSTFGADDLSPRRLTSSGAQALRDFLAYVEQGGRLPHEATVSSAGAPPPGVDALAEAIAARLRRAGAAVDIAYGGMGASGVTVAVRHPTRRDRFVLAVETDAPGGPAQLSVRERERIRPALLERRGWSVHRVYAEAWATDPEGEAKRLVQAYEEAVNAADAYDWAVAAADADVDAGSPSDLDDELRDDVETGEGEVERPSIIPGWTISDYTGRQLAALARWVESDDVAREDAEVVDLMAAELELPLDDSRTRDVLRHAVRVGRAEASPRTEQ
ncbi:hypothetical protein EF847_21495 [Actinobacteria bacterium YIM 96077]|uniref:Restriction endonuclease type II-like domain-containing protein n=1 Tax=Phytoactinopolyspora halophila TaxID=1981511 RepID=A0A329QSW6_9ACTN|nr:DUF4011 domain-containing protein [Phytoactinopolyspora halophila]AYY14875.1 hypothetical protein EF847_21495 [Actinobacteria bacterium YIM 96077]RAW15333.1 hypothetical protein DPM12_08725 [Phytoactinopolyspora halophila]